jgi:two-component system nitrogen regulation sensor histidine kinase NtrY
VATLSLRLWIPLLALLLTLAPLAFAVINVSSGSQAQFEAGFDARVRDTGEAISRRLVGMGQESLRALTRIAADPVVSRELLEPLARGRFYDDERFGHARTMAVEARRLMAAGVLDTLRIVDLSRGGHVIAMGHRTGMDPRDAWLHGLAAAARPSPLFFRLERVESADGGSLRALWTLQAVHVVSRPGLRVAFAGGRALDDQLAEDLRTLAGAGSHVVLEDAAGRRVAATFDAALPPPVEGGYAVSGSELRNPGPDGEEGDPVGRWRVHVPRTELVARNEALWSSALLASVLIGGVVLIVAILMATWLARGLGTLATAATRVAEGGRGAAVELRGPTELRRLADAFNRMVKELEESEDLAAWRELARRIAHEIKNPLSPILLSIETLQRSKARGHPEFDRHFAEATETVLDEVARMERIVTEFSNFARMAAPNPAATDVGALAAQVGRLVEAGAGPVDLEVRLEGDTVAEVDADQVRQVLHNLVQNAAQAAATAVGRSETPRRGRVVVDVWGEEEAVAMEVRDDGVGMSADVLARLFTPYFTTREGGTGLGLAIVRRILDEHAGKIEVFSEAGQGTVIAVRWPRRWRGGEPEGAA